MGARLCVLNNDWLHESCRADSHTEQIQRHSKIAQHHKCTPSDTQGTLQVSRSDHDGYRLFHRSNRCRRMQGTSPVARWSRFHERGAQQTGTDLEDFPGRYELTNTPPADGTRTLRVDKRECRAPPGQWVYRENWDGTLQSGGRDHPKYQERAELLHSRPSFFFFLLARMKSGLVHGIPPGHKEA